MIGGTFGASSGGATAASAAMHAYDHCGRTNSITGTLSSANPATCFFSQNVHDGTPICYYGFRFFSPGTGRWMSRDPIGEKGGPNLYSGLGNSPARGLDADGRSVVYFADVTAAINTGSRPSKHTVNVSGETISDISASTWFDGYTSGKEGTAYVNYGKFNQSYSQSGSGFTGYGPGYRVCNTPSNIRVSAKTDCPGKYLIRCRFMYEASVQGSDEAMVDAKFYVAGAQVDGPPALQDGGYYEPKHGVVDGVINTGDRRYERRMQLSEELQEIGKLLPEMTFRPTGNLQEHAFMSCIAIPIDPPPP